MDAKRYKGRPRRSAEGRLLSPRSEKLLVGRSDCTGPVDVALKQADLWRGALAGDSVAVRGALCFVGADWPRSAETS